jgi:nicotinate-nucleotide adenylyltransferase
VRRDGTPFSIDTVRAYAKEFPGAELFYLIGADQTAQLHLWRESAELARLAEFLVIPRPGEVIAELAAPFRGRALRGFPLGVSSSEIRSRIKAGLPVQHLMPSAVAEAVENNRLYL